MSISKYSSHSSLRLVQRRLWVTVLALFLVLCSGLYARGHASASLERAPRLANIRNFSLDAGLGFEANLGQFDPSVRFYLRINGGGLLLTNEGLVFAPHRKALGFASAPRIKIVGASSATQVEGTAQLPARSNYFRGRDPGRWITDVPQYDGVRYENVYPGVDVVFRRASGGVEFDWVVAAGANPKAIRMAFNNVTALYVDHCGDLVAQTDGVLLRSAKPVVYQESATGRTIIPAAYRINPRHEVTVELTSYDPAKTLTIDPVLTYSSVFGGSGESNFPDFSFDAGSSIAVDSQGNAYIAGTAYSQDFQPAGKFFGTTLFGYNAFVAKLSPDGHLIFISFFGFSTASSVAVDPNGYVYVVGSTSDVDFPATNAFQQRSGGSNDAFIAKLIPAGSALVYATFLGGSAAENASSMAVAPNGNIYVAGSTSSSDFPITPGAAQTKYRSPGSGFVTKISAGGTLIYSTFVGQLGRVSIAIDGEENAYIAGETTTLDLPTTPGAFQAACQRASFGTACGFIVKLSPNGSVVRLATYLTGGSPAAIAVDVASNIYVAGVAYSSDLPTTKGAFQETAQFSTSPNHSRTFVTKLNSTASALVYSTYIAGSDAGEARGIAVDASGNAYIAGETMAKDFPLVRPLQAALGEGRCGSFNEGLRPCFDAFVAQLSAAGSTLIWSTYFGGSRDDFANAIAVRDGNIYITGQTQSPDLPTTIPPGTPRGTIFVALISQSADAPVFTAASVTNAASFASALTPGSLATAFGLNLTGASGIVSAEGFPLPPQIDGSSLTINGIAAPLLAIANVNGREQINFVVPWEIASQTSATLVISNHGVSSLPVNVPVIAAQPGIFTIDGLHAAAQHSSDYSLITNTHPAQPGEIILLYATGLGAVSPAVATGERAPAQPLSKTIVTPTVLIGGSAANVRYSGLAPGYLGLYQLNVLVPQGLPAGDLDVLIQIGGHAGNTVKLSVR